MPFAGDGSIPTLPFSNKIVMIKDSFQVTDSEANAGLRLSGLLAHTDLSPGAKGEFYSESTVRVNAYSWSPRILF